jgi:hypothetical protein
LDAQLALLILAPFIFWPYSYRVSVSDSLRVRWLVFERIVPFTHILSVMPEEQSGLFGTSRECLRFKLVGRRDLLVYSNAVALSTIRAAIITSNDDRG